VNRKARIRYEKRIAARFEEPAPDPKPRTPAPKVDVRGPDPRALVRQAISAHLARGEDEEAARLMDSLRTKPQPAKPALRLVVPPKKG
jgi:hypothetical protein